MRWRPYVVALLTLLTFFSQVVFATYPPTRTKGANDANSVVTFDFQFPFFNLQHGPPQSSTSLFSMTDPLFQDMATPAAPGASTHQVWFGLDDLLHSQDSAGSVLSYQAQQPLPTGEYHVATNGTDSVNCGRAADPCLTFGKVFTNYGGSLTAADVKKPLTVIASGGIYDEALTIPNGRIVTIIALGTVVFGDGAGANWASTNSRDVNITFNTADLHGSDIKPAVTFIALPRTDMTSTFIAEAGGIYISGNLNLTGDGVTNTLNTFNVKVAGNFVHTDAGLTNWQSEKTIVLGTVTTTGNLVLERATESRFNGLLSVAAVNEAFNSSFPAGITVQNIQLNLLPNGFFHCNIGGTFTGPASSARFDLATNYQFTTVNAGVLGGAATKVLVETTTSVPTANTVAGWDASSNMLANAFFTSSYVDFLEIATPASPAANHDRCYTKVDGYFYCKNAAGTETLIGPIAAGSGGGGSTILVSNTNGFGGSTVTAGSTVTISVNTTVNASVLKGDGNSIIPAVAGTDYQAPGAYITAIAGDLIATGPGVANGLIPANVVTNPKLAQMAPSTFKGNSTLATANATDLTAASVVTILQTPLNALYCALTGCSMTGAISMGSNFIRAVTDPVLAQDAATKAYVDSQLAQLNPAERVQAASLANIAGVYTNVVPGVCIADTFTTTATTAFALDGYSGALGDRFLFKNQTSSFQDGVWVLTTQAVGGVSGAILTRALDFDNSADINSGQIIPIINGTQAGSSYFQTANVTTCSSDAQTWTQFTKPSSAYLQAANNFSDVANSTLAFNAVAPQSAVKGDLIVFNGTNWVRVGAGSTGSVLSVDPTTSEGVSWGSTSTIAITASDIDWSLATPLKNLYTKTLSANTAFTFSNVTHGKNIIVAVDNTPSNYTVSWPINTGWSSSTVPVQTTGSHTDVYTFIYRGGPSVLGSAVQNF